MIPSFIQYGNPVSQFFRFLQILGGKKDGNSRCLEFFYQLPHTSAALGIQAGGRFIQKNHLGMACQAHGNIQFPFHSSGIGRNPLVCRVGLAEILQKIPGGFFRRGSWRSLAIRTRFSFPVRAPVYCRKLTGETDDLPYFMGIF